MSKTITAWSLSAAHSSECRMRDNYANALVHFRLLPWGVKGLHIDTWMQKVYSLGI